MTAVAVRGLIQEIGKGLDQEVTKEDDDHEIKLTFYVFRIFKENFHWSKTDTFFCFRKITVKWVIAENATQMKIAVRFFAKDFLLALIKEIF